MTVLQTVSAAIAPPVPGNSALIKARERLAEYDQQLAELRKVETELREADQARLKAIAAGDDMASLVALQKIQRLQKTYDPNAIGILDGNRLTFISGFVSGGPTAERLTELKAFLGLFEMFFVRMLDGSRDHRSAAALKVATEVTGQLTAEENQIRNARLDLLFNTK